MIFRAKLSSQAVPLVETDHEEKKKGVKEDTVIHKWTKEFREYSKDQRSHNRAPKRSYASENKHGQKSTRLEKKNHRH
jgi:hypothetical protein